MKLRPLLLTGLILSALLMGVSAWEAGSVGAQTTGDPVGNISVDADPVTTTNTSSSVGTIETTLAVTDDPGGAPFIVELVIGDAGSSDADPSGGIPEGTDIAGWAATIQFDPAVLTFKGFLVKDCSEDPLFDPPLIGYFMEKADNCDQLTDNHISVVTPPIVDGGGQFDIGSTITGTPSGANGVGRIARLVFDSATSGAAGTCIRLLPLLGSEGSRYTDIDEITHPFANLQGAGIGLNGGTPPTDCLQAPTPTPSPTPSPSPGGPTPTPTPTPTGGTGATPTPTSTPTSAPAGTLPRTGDGNGAGGGWVAPAIILAAGLALLASGGALWRYYGKRSRRPAGGA